MNLDAQSLRVAHFEAMVQFDMGAIRNFLVKKNNDGELNLNRLVLVGSEMGAAVAVEWAAYDWSLPNYEHAQLKQSQDVKALVLISPKPSFKGLKTGQTINHPALRQRISIMLLIGANDPRVASNVGRMHKRLAADRGEDRRFGQEERRDVGRRQPHRAVDVDLVEPLVDRPGHRVEHDQGGDEDGHAEVAQAGERGGLESG